MKTSSLLDIMKTKVQAERGRWRDISAEALVGYDWLTRVMDGRIKDPGVARVERVISAVDSIRNKRAA